MRKSCRFLGVGYGCFVHLFVTLQFPYEGSLLEQGLQTFLSVIMAELLKSGPTLILHLTRVLEPWCVHNQQRTERMLTGLQRSESRRRYQNASLIQ